MFRYCRSIMWIIWLENPFIWCIITMYSFIHWLLVTPYAIKEHGQVWLTWLMAISHYLNQCWLISNEVLWHSTLQVMHICVDKLTIVGSDNGLSPGRCQAISWTNAVIFLIGLLGTNFSENLIINQMFSFNIMRMKMSSAKWCPFWLGLIVWNLF